MELFNHCEKNNKSKENIERCIQQNLFGRTVNKDYHPFDLFSFCEKMSDKTEARKCVDKVMMSWLEKNHYFDTAYAFRICLNRIEDRN
jgi:hypothetical protein